MRSLEHISIIGEGCLDIALAYSIISRAKRKLGIEIGTTTQIVRGWERAISYGIELAGGQKSPVKVIVYVDSDFSSRERFDHVDKIIKLKKSYLQEEYTASFHGNKTIISRHYKFEHGGSLGIVLWVNPLRPGEGTVEDLLLHAMIEAYDCSFPSSDLLGKLICSDNCREKTARRVSIARKLSVLVMLAACSGEGTLAAIEHNISRMGASRCGLNISRSLDILNDLWHTVSLEEYVNITAKLLKDILET